MPSDAPANFCLMYQAIGSQYDSLTILAQLRVVP